MSKTKDKIYGVLPADQPGLGPGSGGQSGDTQGLSDIEEVDSESVVELLEEGQFYEAEVINAIENAPDPDVSELHTAEELEEKRRRRHRA